MISRLFSPLVFAWLVIGTFAAGQRGYFTHMTQNCADFGTIALNVIAGPLNYTGVNPKLSDCTLPHPDNLPQPSQ